MVSRGKIISRSWNDLHAESTFQPPPDDEEDIWHQKDKLYRDHIQEVLDKWTQIDDEIWAKVIVFERNRRVAKAYARAPVLTVNGSDDGFDGFRIGLCGFDNPMRDQKTEEYKRHIGHGVKIKMDDAGNILIKRVSQCNVYIQDGENAIGNVMLKLPGCALESEKPVKLFDMKQFQSNVKRELRRAYPDRRRLESQCLSAIAFVKAEQELLECPIWVLIINVVAMDMLKSKLPPGQRVIDIKNRPRIPIPDEDPYSVAGVAATREQPHRENVYPHDIPRPDYDDHEDAGRLKPFTSSRSNDKSKGKQTYDDPYYCGLRAHVPNFVAKSKKDGGAAMAKQFSLSQHQQLAAAADAVGAAATTTQQLQLSVPSNRHPHSMWHTRSYEDGIDSDAIESPYNQIYGRLPLPTRSFIPANPPRTMYIGEWD